MGARPRDSVLLVDSAHQQREIYALALEHAGYFVLQASTGSHGHELALRERVFAVVAAIGLARDGCGWPFIRMLRQDSRTAHLPLVVLATADVMREVEEATALGVAAVFITPLVPDRLIDTLRRLDASRSSITR